MSKPASSLPSADQPASFHEAFAAGSLAFQRGRKLEWCEYRGPLQAAWWRRGWRYEANRARILAGLDAADEAERRELVMDPSTDWEGLRC